MAGWFPQEPTKTGYDSIVRTKRSERGLDEVSLVTGARLGPESADPERAERFTGFYECGCGWKRTLGGYCPRCGKTRTPVMRP